MGDDKKSSGVDWRAWRSDIKETSQTIIYLFGALGLAGGALIYMWRYGAQYASGLIVLPTTLTSVFAFYKHDWRRIPSTAILPCFPLPHLLLLAFLFAQFVVEVAFPTAGSGAHLLSLSFAILVSGSIAVLLLCLWIVRVYTRLALFQTLFVSHVARSLDVPPLRIEARALGLVSIASLPERWVWWVLCPDVLTVEPDEQDIPLTR